MQLIKPDINVNFVGWRNKAFMLSGTIILVGTDHPVCARRPQNGGRFCRGHADPGKIR